MNTKLKPRLFLNLFLSIVSGLVLFLLCSGSFSRVQARTPVLPQISAVKIQDFSAERDLAFQRIITPTLTTTASPEWQLFGFELEGIVSIAFSPNFANDQTIAVGTTSDIFLSHNQGNTWTPAGFSTPTTIRDLVFSPHYASDRTIFGSGGGGVYRSVDGGNTWLSVGLTDEVIWSLAISHDYAHDQTIFAGSTSDNAAGQARIYRSTDGGDTWQQVASTAPGFTIRALPISPDYANDKTLFAGLGQSWNWYNGGVYRSTDGGDNWSAVNTGLTYQEVHDLYISPNYATDQTLFVAVWAGGIYRSTNGGDTWQAANNGYPNRRPHTLAFSPNYANDQTVFLGTWGENANGGVYRSVDRGETWAIMRDGLQTLWLHTLALSPNYGNYPVLLAGGEKVNGGGLWIYGDLFQPKVYLPVIVNPGPMTRLYVTSINTGGINPVEIRDPNDGNKLLLSCTVGNNTTEFCGSFPAVGSYQVVANPVKCTISPVIFHDALPGATVTREIGCN